MTSNRMPIFEPLAERHLAGVAALEALVSPSPWSRDLFAGELEVAAAQRHWLVAVDADQANGGGGVVGFAGMMFVDDVGHLMNIAVHPSWQGRGLGRRLAAEVFTEAVERGMQRLTLEVRASNSAALALYEHFGFAAAGTRTGYYRDGEDATILWAEHIAEPDFRAVIDRGAHPVTSPSVTSPAVISPSVTSPAVADPAETGDVVLAIETSCDETSVAVVRGGTEVLANVVSSQVDLHARFGGVVPEVASRAHLELLEPVLAEALAEANVSPRDLDAVAATHGPGLIGALLVGVSAAKALAVAWDTPYVGVNHMEGHLFATFLERPNLPLPAVVLLVSGGHTMLVEIQALGSYRLLGSTTDDAAGEAFDKVARYLGLGYPGGPAIDALSVEGDATAVAFPRALMDGSLDFSFSGMKTAVINYVRKNPDAGNADLAASFQEAVVDVLVDKAMLAGRRVGAASLCLGGGVAANRRLRERFAAEATAQGFEVLVPDRAYCTDNAAMIAAVASWRLGNDGPTGLDDGAHPSLVLPTV